MNKKDIKNYLYKLGEICGFSRNFHYFAVSLVDLCENDPFIRYMDSSRFESSLPLSEKIENARFLHYLKFKKDLPLKIRKFAGYLAAFRIIRILKLAGFSDFVANEIVNSIGRLWMVFPNTIVSAEWNMREEKFIKFTLYVVCGKSFNKKICRFFSENLKLNVNENTIYRLTRDIDFFGVDFFKNGNICFKIYNRFPISLRFRPEKWEKKFLMDFKNYGVKTVIRVSKIWPERKKTVENEKTHFIIDGISFYLFERIYKMHGLKKIYSILKDKKIEVVSVNKDSLPVEIYFD